jgi:beta-hydroxyacyl-ACP dehydratase FabZ
VSLSFDIRRILDILPHRHPIVMVDRVLELDAGQRILAIKNVSFNESYFPGHFPGNPVMPGVLIVEALAQAGGILLAESRAAEVGDRPYLVGVDQVRFRRQVVPGDQLRMEVNLVSSHAAYHRLKGSATVEGQRAAEAQMLLAVMPSSGEQARP